jgi:hypothetical protein
MPGRAARISNIVLGGWLFVSAFLWTHTPTDRVSSWVVGLAIVAFAVIATTIPAARWVNRALAVWVFISAFALPHLHAGTRWNEVIVALFVFVLTIVPPEEDTTRDLGAEEHARA